MQFQDYYAILGVPKDASADTIKKAYRKLARQYHPDVSQAPDASARMAEINEANDVLGDAEKRAAYDAVGAQAWAQGARSQDDVRPPPGWNSGFEFTGTPGDERAGDHSAFFEELFGRAARAQRGSGRSGGGGAMRGSDHHARIEIDLADAYSGAERAITLRGAHLDAQGQVVGDERTLQVKIPAGVRDGQMIRLAGQGSPGVGGGPAGDLLLEVQLRSDARWRAEGADVIQRLFVSPWELALGAEVAVQTPGGSTLTVTIPAGSNVGRKLRLKGRGLPAPSASSVAGDLYLELAAAIPSPVTDAQRTAWRTLADAYPGFNPRA